MQTGRLVTLRALSPSALRPTQACKLPLRAAANVSRTVKPRQMAQPAGERSTFNIAIEGCCHGELDTIYSTLQLLEQKEGKKIDLLICCGDFQAVRNLDDMECMAVPDKYKQIMTFYKYYSGEKQAPYPTLFIGGNHEAMNYLWELHYGGWAAPNIYFLGYSGVVQFGGHRIGGVSGTYSSAHYDWGHFEAPPYPASTLRSAYHVRKLHTYRLLQLKQHVDIFLSHDWPLLITRHGNRERLFAKKPYFKAEAERNELGSQAAQELLEQLRPSYWFAAHLHVKFPAIVLHQASRTGQQQQQQQQQGLAVAGVGGPGSGETRFLALDKCLPRREFLQVLELPVQGPLRLQYDPEWLAVLRSTHQLLSLQKYPPPLPANWGGRAGGSAEDVAFVEQLLRERGGADIPVNFVPTAAAYNPASRAQRGSIPKTCCRNPQTVAFLEMLGLEYNLEHTGQSQGQQQQQQHRAAAAAAAAAAALPRGPAVAVMSNPEDIPLSDDDDEEEEEEGGRHAEDGVSRGDEGQQQQQQQRGCPAAAAATAAAMARAAEVLKKAGVDARQWTASVGPEAAAAGEAAADDAEIPLDDDGSEDS